MFEGIIRYFTLNTMDGKVVGSNGKINIVPASRPTSATTA